MQTDVDGFAEVLVAMGNASGCLHQVENELSAVLPLITENERVREFLSDPGIRTEGKRKAIGQLAGDVHSALGCFLCFLADEHQLNRLGDVADLFFQKVSRMRKEASGELVSAVALGPETIAQVERETGNLLGKKVSLRPRVDPELLGGLYVRVGDFVIDGTVDRQLSLLRQTLVQ